MLQERKFAPSQSIAFHVPETAKRERVVPSRFYFRLLLKQVLAPCFITHSFRRVQSQHSVHSQPVLALRRQAIKQEQSAGDSDNR